MISMHDSGTPPQVTDLRKLSDALLLERLSSEGDRLDRATVDEIIRRGGLVEQLGNLVADPYNWNEPQPAWWAVVHAVYILGAMHSSDTVLPLLRALRYAEACENDWVSEDLPSIFGAVGGPAVEGLLSLAGDRTNGWYCRAIAMEGLAAITIGTPALAEDVFGRIRTFFRGDEDRMVRQAAAHVLLDFLRSECRDELLAFGKEERLASAHAPAYRPGFSDKDVESEFSRGQQVLERYTRDWLRFYEPESISERQVRWEKERQTQADRPEHAPAYELCPFAADRKRKKCCLGKAGIA